MAAQKGFTGDEMRRLLRRVRTATLATLNREGGIPYGSLVNLASDVDGRPVIFVSELAWHTRNLLADGRASLMASELPATGDALTGARVTVMGRFLPCAEERVRRRYLARHPEANFYAGFPDFAYWRLEPELIHAVAGFGRIETRMPDEVFPPAREMTETEDSAIAHMNDDHAEAVSRLARRLGGAAEEAWKIAAIDPDGCDLVAAGRSLRLEFPEPVFSAAQLRVSLARLSSSG
ncbi:MAG: HugZ family protein [Alphaproteobacteria bacterium]|nr:HugZ family protein [Alphaproteobacteria bacterium]